jgi:hypothetical protein
MLFENGTHFRARNFNNQKTGVSNELASVIDSTLKIEQIHENDVFPVTLKDFFIIVAD